MNSNSSIKIFVSGHKACVLPRSEFYVPVQVGAANRAERFRGMIPDDQGDNISNLNYSFSELTAQYWAWRNTESDYVGACHYRRYFCLDGEKHTGFKNDHMQIEVNRLCPSSIDEYSIDNEQLIRQVATSYDAVVPEEWDVGTTMTPQGVKTTVRDHMKGYGLIKDAAYDLLEQIVNSRHPEYAADLHGYLYGKTYLGYSCFIMRRELFDRMCAFEFDVLMEFTKSYDDPDRTSTQMRLGGYLGEILFSTFILHIKGEGASVGHYPLAFFHETDPLINSNDDVSETAIHHIVWDTDGRPAEVIGVCAKTLVSALSADEKWEISFALSSQNELAAINQAVGQLPLHVTMRFVTKPIHDSRNCGQLGKRALERNPESGLLCLAPWLFGKWKDALFLQNAVIFSGSLHWKSFVSAAAEANLSVLAAQDVYVSAELNCGANSRSVELATSLDVSTRELRDYSVCYMNLAMLRDSYNQDDIARKALAAFEAAERISSELNCIDRALLVNASLASYASGELSLEHFYPIAQSDTVSRWCYADLSTAWASANAASAQVAFYTKTADPLGCNTTVDDAVFWQAARTTPVYEKLLSQMNQKSEDLGREAHSGLKEVLFPEGSKRRLLARRSLYTLRRLQR